MQGKRIRQFLVALGPLVCISAGLLVGIYHQSPLTVGTLYALALLWAAVPLLMTRRASRSTLDDTDRKALESSPCASAVIDETGHVVWVNAAFAAQIDRSKESVTGTPLTDLAREDLWAELEGRREELNSGGVIDVSACLVRPDDEEIWVAAPAVSIAVGDSVSWVGGMDMGEFTSRSLGRTFDDIRFVERFWVH